MSSYGGDVAGRRADKIAIARLDQNHVRSGRLFGATTAHAIDDDGVDDVGRRGTRERHNALCVCVTATVGRHAATDVLDRTVTQDACDIEAPQLAAHAGDQVARGGILATAVARSDEGQRTTTLEPRCAEVAPLPRRCQRYAVRNAA
nr:hypothetical protein [Pandoravirus belohorizontensis]